jgi:GntR family transcriptional regulator of arabinose operon
LYNTIKQSGIPIVLINSSYPELSIPYVSLDDVKAGYIATQYLLSMGHTNIAGVFPHIKQQGHLRYLGYVKALAEQGIPFQDERVFWYSNDEFLQMMQEDLLWESLFSCTAAVCFNDQMALKLIDFVRQKGLSVPEDFSVVGIDDSELAKISSLTSIVHPSEQLGDAAAKLLLSMINGYEGKSILFQPQLQIRGSVGQRDSKI